METKTTPELKQRTVTRGDRWIVYWRYKSSRGGGHGSPLPKSIAAAAVERGNAEWPHIRHWMMPLNDGAYRMR